MAAGRAFCSGYDLTEDADEGELDARGWHEGLAAGTAKMLEILDCPKPVIASVQSYCLAGGTDLMLACDLAVVADDAKFGYVDIRFGSGVVSMLLPWVVGVRTAKELLFTGEDRISADDALRVGMVNRVVPRDELDDATLALAEEIAKNEPFVVQMTKRALNRAWDVAGFRAAMAANTELDVLIETTNLPARDEFRRITSRAGAEGGDRLARREVPRRRLVTRLEPPAAAGAALDRDRRGLGVAGLVGARDRAVAASPRLRGRAVPDQPEVRHGVGAAVPVLDHRAAARRRPGRVRGAGARRRADDR